MWFLRWYVNFCDTAHLMKAFTLLMELIVSYIQVTVQRSKRILWKSSRLFIFHFGNCNFTKSCKLGQKKISWGHLVQHQYTKQDQFWSFISLQSSIRLLKARAFLSFERCKSLLLNVWQFHNNLHFSWLLSSALITDVCYGGIRRSLLGLDLS